MLFQRGIKGLQAVVEKKSLFPALYQSDAKIQAISLGSSISRCHMGKPGCSDAFLQPRELSILFAMQ